MHYGCQNGANCEADQQAVCAMGAICAVWELPAPYESHMEALWAVREVDGTIWEPNVPYGGLYGSQLRCI
jgi:hypothetical protein